MANNWTLIEQRKLDKAIEYLNKKGIELPNFAHEIINLARETSYADTDKLAQLVENDITNWGDSASESNYSNLIELK